MKTFTWISWACMALPVLAATPPPEREPFHDSRWAARSKTKPAPAFRMGAFNARFEETTLTDVMKKVGAGAIEHRGDAGESLYWLCYTVGNNQRLWITAHGEIGGPEHRITEIRAQWVAAAKPTEDCPSLPRNLRSVSLENGIWLGVAEHTALQALSDPSSSKESWRLFFYQGKVPGRCEPDGYDLGNWLMLNFANGRTDALIAGQVTSC